MILEVFSIVNSVRLNHIASLSFAQSFIANFFVSGLPDCNEDHFAEFEKVWTNMQRHNPQPITLLMTLTNTLCEAQQVCDQWKLSNAERNLAKFIVTHRQADENKDVPLKYYKDILVAHTYPKTIDTVNSHVLELLHYHGKYEEANEIRNWTVPKFPLGGADLKKAGLKPSPLFGKVMLRLKELWIESFYTLQADELLEKVEHVRNELEHKQLEQNKKNT